jgi:hypothetical protein
MKKRHVGFQTVPQNSMKNLNKKRIVREMVLATVKKVHPDRYTCDVTTENGSVMKNVPVMAECGLIGDTQEIYGTFDMPEVESSVIIIFVGGTADKPLIINASFFPYLYDAYGKSQTAVNSSSKAETKKLLEEGKERYYRKIFKSGTTVEVTDDGTIKVEVPSGSIVTVDESSDLISIKHNNGSEILVDVNMSVKHNNGSEIVINGSELSVTHNNGSKVTIDGIGISVKHTSGPEVYVDVTGITLKSGDATIWQPNTLPACLFSGAPHGGVSGGISKLKGG